MPGLLSSFSHFWERSEPKTACLWGILAVLVVRNTRRPDVDGAKSIQTRESRLILIFFLSLPEKSPRVGCRNPKVPPIGSAALERDHRGESDAAEAVHQD